jgi:fluoroquinolone resistance protein
MNEFYIEGKTFDKVDFNANPLAKGDYEDCHFINCNFSKTDLSNFFFSGCEFTGCDLSLVKLVKTAFQNIKFKDCKMLGLLIGNCNAFGIAFNFDNCILNHSSFYKIKIKKTVFRNCQLQETDFTEADLTGAVFDACDLLKAIFDHTVLEKADFRNAYNYLIDPEINRLRKAKFSLQGIPGLLAKYDIEIDGN